MGKIQSKQSMDITSTPNKKAVGDVNGKVDPVEEKTAVNGDASKENVANGDTATNGEVKKEEVSEEKVEQEEKAEDGEAKEDEAAADTTTGETWHVCLMLKIDFFQQLFI